ncbi:Fpg/Nei family DNA glycosylase [Patulibacter defluvii]|uniref:Fpg/Nei family DNA glycosylase n=1 Tax=Patulibacter defluvii TaxID=3095358 RepID=UPI002A76028E|nr:DNA-formamidopyrimidine glycosylase family protein [Patulibacter sp. DM4]
MPELPEVEAARALADRWTTGRTVVDVEDADEWVCRPHPPGEIAAAVTGRRITGVGRIGKSLWLDLDDGHRLGLHLGMAGRLVAMAPEGVGPDHEPGVPPAELPETAGEPLTASERTSWSMPVRSGVRELPGDGSWTRFALDLDDGARLLLFDKRRLARVRLDPDLSTLGPDALTVDAESFAERVGRGAAPLKARLMDQSVIAGVGNLLCDEVLWQAAQSPLRPAGELSRDELDELHEILIAGTREAIARGGVHLGDVIPYRRKGEHCPRCGAAMVRGTVGGRTTWWCSREQE